MRIDVFMPPIDRSRYGVVPHFTIKFAEALTRVGVECRILTANKDDPKSFLEALFLDPPDCTLSFNGLLPDQKGNFFCDNIKIPHVACLTDPPTHYLVLAASPYTIITCPDRFGCDFFKGLGCKNVLFMPHAIEPEIIIDADDIRNRKYDVVMLSSGIDYLALEKEWSDKFSKNIIDAMNETIDIVLSNDETSCIQAFVQTMDRHMSDSRITPGVYHYPEIFHQIELYAKGKERVKLAQSVKDVPLHIFGSHIDVWKKYLRGQTNIEYHDSVSFNVALEIMKKSKILLNSYASLKDGTHERILSGIASGALVITNENIYMKEHFQENLNIGFYQMGKWSRVNEKINLYLKNPDKISNIVANGKDLISSQHTWDQRAATFVKELVPTLKRVKNER